MQSDVVVTELLPERHAPTWPAFAWRSHVFGGNTVGRLFTDVREKRSLAYRADARVMDLAHGAEPLFAQAGTKAAKTADAVQGILDDLAGLKSSPPSDAEVAGARRSESDIFAVRMETIGSIADLVAQIRTVDLPDDYWDTYRAALRAVPTAEADAAAARAFTADRALIVVAGDADVVAEPLARFGDVTVVDPEHDFRVLRTLPSTIPKSGTK